MGHINNVERSEYANFANQFLNFCYNQHDVVCNQKYGEGLPYSFHLKGVVSQAEYFSDKVNQFNHPVTGGISGLFGYEKTIVKCIAGGHDLYEDARVTYNDVLAELSRIQMTFPDDQANSFNGIKEVIAEGIFGCTESTGRNRKERHDDASFERLVERPYSVYVKLCDISANLTYSMLFRTSFYGMYKNEWPNVKTKLGKYEEDYKPMFEHIEKLIS